MQENTIIARGYAAVGHYEEGLTAVERAGFERDNAEYRAYRAAKDAKATKPAKTTMPALHEPYTAFNTTLLKIALFSCNERGARKHFTEEEPNRLYSIDGDEVVFVGEELRQDDRAVLLALIKMASGKELAAALTFQPHPFVREVLGWGDGGLNVKKLGECLHRLKKAAEVQVKYAKGGKGTLSFVSDYDTPAEGRRGEWTVWLAPRMLEVFAKRVTYLAVADCKGLTGLQAWLYGFVNADPCKSPFALADMLAWSGKSSVQKEFNRALGESLDELKKKGLVVDFVMSRTEVTITRVPF